MKDIITSQKNISNDTHLKNIFINDSYLELGIIDVDVIKRLLNYELININEITFFPVQNRGLGHSVQNDEYLKKYLPFHFFRNLVLNNANLQLCISYGLLHYHNSDRREAFMPIIFIPINMYWENGNLLVQMVSRPFINPRIFSVIIVQRSSSLHTTELKDIYSLDYVLSVINKMNDLSVRLDNYLTYVEIKDRDIILFKGNPINRVSQDRGYKREEFDQVYLNCDKNIYMNQVFNKTQRETITRLVNGESLTITGYNGTGKTTILKSFIVNNLANGKKTLYVSNLQDSIDKMKKYLDDLMLSNYLVDLTESFKSISNNNILELYYDPIEDIAPLCNQLNEYYKYLDEYEKEINDSLFGFRFTDMVKGRFLVDTDKANKVDDKWVEIEDLSNIYRHEYETINDMLVGIEDSFKKIKSFSNSIWKEIPIINNITHINQVINVVYQLNSGLKKLREYEIGLGNFGVKSILSFSEMKKCITPMSRLNVEVIPDSWKEDIGKFEKARTMFPTLRKDITHYKDKVEEQGNKYRNLEGVDIVDSISSLYDKYYTNKDLAIIERLLRDKVDLRRVMSNAYICIKDFNNVYQELSARMNWNFLEKEEHLKEFMQLVELFKKYYVSCETMTSILNNKVASDINELNNLNKSIIEILTDINALETKNPRLRHLDFSKGNIDYVNEIYRTYDTKQKKYKRFVRDYTDICGFSYEQHEANIDSINGLKDYYDSIKQNKCRKTIIDFILTIKDNEYIEYLSLFDIFTTSLDRIKEISKVFESYQVSFKNLSTASYVEKFTNYVGYLKKLFSDNERLMDVVIDNSLSYVVPSAYYEIEESINEISDIVKDLENNKTYKDLYGVLYKANNTDVVSIIESIDMFDKYREVFIENEKIYNSFVHYNELKEIIDKIVELIDEIGENLRLYSLIFKDSVSRYYFSNIENNVEYLTKLLDSQEELSIYLSITRGIGILNEYKLFSIIKFIEENDDIEGVSSKFSLVYFDGIIKRYLSMHPDITDSKRYTDTITKAVALEDVICRQRGIKYVNEILRNIPVDIKKKKVKYFNYQDYFDANKNRLRIYLANKNFITQYYKYMDYDTIIIDDAHMLFTGDYNNILRNKQAVICGDYQTNMIVNQSLLSMATTENLVVLRNRYVAGPRKLTINMSSFFAPHQLSLGGNSGIKVIEKGLDDYLYNLYMQNNKVVINLFIRDINTMRQAYEEISKSFFKKNIPSDEIITFLNENICVCDINVKNYLASDINIIYLKDYYNENSQIVANNLYEILMLAKEELIIYDNSGLLLKNVDSSFYKMIKDLVVEKDVFRRGRISDVTALIEKELNSRGYNVYYSGNGVNMLIELPNSEELVTLFILYSNDNSSEVLNSFRDFYNQYFKNGHKVIVRNVVDLLDGHKAFVDDLCHELVKKEN